MRLQIQLQVDGPRGLSIPLDYHEYLTAAIYGLIARADREFARVLHDEGFAVGDGSQRRFKLFTYSKLRAPASRRRIDNERDRIVFSPGPITWILTSPVEDLIAKVTGGMLAAGMLQVGSSPLRIECIHVVPTPVFQETMKFTCLSPIVAASPLPKEDGGGTRFVRPLEDPAGFSLVVRNNLIAKYRTLNGEEPADTRFDLSFDQDYLARAPHNGQKMINFKGTHIIGTEAPFTITGNPALIQTGYESGFGNKNALGNGCSYVGPGGGVGKPLPDTFDR